MSVKEETMKAYGDSNEYSDSRNLHWIADEPVSVEYAVKIMREALGLTCCAYNRFEPGLIRKVNEVFKGSPEVYLAREGSVCIYVKGVLKEKYKMKGDDESDISGRGAVRRVFKADEFHKPGEIKRDPDYLEGTIRPKNTYRIWWD